MPKKKESTTLDLSEATPAQVAKAFAKDLDLLSSVGSTVQAEWLPTGLDSLDKALGIGGLPLGRMVELFGPEAVGKTSLALHFIACAQKAGGRAVFIDAEHALDLGMAKFVGVDIDNLMFTQPDQSAESVLQLVRRLLDSKAADIIVIDSVAALVPQAQMDKEFTKRTMGEMPRVMSDTLKIIQRNTKKSKAIVIFINQTRSKIGVMFGNPETTTGGNALKFYAGIRMRMSRLGPIKKGAKTVGMESKVFIPKNKCAQPYKSAVLKVIYGKGWQDGGFEE